MCTRIFDSWARYTSLEARTLWLYKLYTFTVPASVVPELNISMWREFYFPAFSFSLTVLSCPLSLSSLSSAKSFFTDQFFYCSSAKQFVFVSDCLGHCACASSSFGEKAKAPWSQVQQRRSTSNASGVCEVDDIRIAQTDATVSP